MSQSTSSIPCRARWWVLISAVTINCFALPISAPGQLENTFYGSNAGFFNSTGDRNSAFGDQALVGNRAGSDNTAIGLGALGNNSASNNTAVGSLALQGNSTGQYNTALGREALASSSGNIGSFNTATGARALYSNRDGGVNVATGYKALETNTGGFYNVASGAFALGTNTTGGFNTATGANALYYNNGNSNTGIGHQALQNNRTGGSNVALGYQAGVNLTTGNNNIVIGANVLGAAGDANKIRIGKQGTQSATYIAGIHGKSVLSASGVAVFVDNTGKLGTIKSSARYKEQIKPMDKSSESILKLEPVTFRYKQELDPDGVAQFGLIAEQVEKVNPDLVVRDENGKVETVRYEAVNAMLLNEFLKEHRKVEEQAAMTMELKSAVASQRDIIAKQQKQIEALTAGLQKVNARIALEKAGQRMTAND